MRNILGNILWLFIGAFAVISSLRLGIGDIRRPGAGFVLFLAGSLFIGCILLQATLNGASSRSEKHLSATWPLVPGRPVIVVVIAALIYLAVLEKLGYLFTTFAFMLLLFGLNRIKLRIVMICALSSVAASYCIFQGLLKVPLPKGFFGF
jgi:putative tricarboxylic transport membrane protein